MFSADILWLAPSSWREVQTSLDHHMRLYADYSATLTSLAEAIADNLQAVDPVMDDLCAATCPYCPDPCCQRADVCYDFRDLLFLHCRQEALPVHQPKVQPGRPCSFLGQKGCVLPRSLRPFLCTWYVCPVQMHMVRDASCSGLTDPSSRLQGIQQLRKDLESEFINLVLMRTNIET